MIGGRGLVLVLAFAVSACAGKKEEPVEPEGPELWVPDESLEQARLHEVEAPEEDPYADLSEDERLEKAKELYAEAEGHFAKEEWRDAEVKYEQAYHLVPGKHGFAYKVAMSAVAAGDCHKAKLFLDHFVEYADPVKYEAKFEEVKKARAELEC
jgi:hypothetical protein